MVQEGLLLDSNHKRERHSNINLFLGFCTSGEKSLQKIYEWIYMPCQTEPIFKVCIFHFFSLHTFNNMTLDHNSMSFVTQFYWCDFVQCSCISKSNELWIRNWKKKQQTNIKSILSALSYKSTLEWTRFMLMNRATQCDELKIGYFIGDWTMAIDFFSVVFFLRLQNMKFSKMILKNTRSWKNWIFRLKILSHFRILPPSMIIHGFET